AGHGAVAAGALRWGEPVLDSAITAIRSDGPWYRGLSACRAAREGACFESIAEHLWEEHDAQPWGGGSALAVPRGLRPVDAIAMALVRLAVKEPDRHLPTREPTLRIARRLIPQLVSAVAHAQGGRERARRAAGAKSVAEALAIAFGVTPRRRVVRAIDATLVVSADHELNPSSFTARVSASAGADLYACLSAAIATLSGPRHGGVPERIATVLDQIGRPERAAAVVRERLGQGEAMPGFNHPLYPSGDPRFEVLLEQARAIGGRRRSLAVVEALVGAMDLAGGAAPNYDLGTTAIAAALGLGPHAATALFAIGRSAGWVAHVIEQRQAGFLLRPRARYVGV
ncbi:MAG TPA: citrate synthase, partial [Polyangiaceae bacterium]|nr:citrate synthase [Polyangiaceae bacterium]